VTSMRAGTDPAREPLAGAVFAVEAGVRGHAQHRLVASGQRAEPGSS